MIIEQTDRENISLRMRGQVLSEMNHAYLNNWIGLPEPESFQLTTALAILQAAGCPEEETKLLSTVLLLVYHGLSIHEHIDETNSLEEKYRQLHVLAGDYYSSKYFYLLADGGKIDLIGLFAETIARINEAKVELAALGHKADMEKYMAIQERIYGGLLEMLCSHYLRNQTILQDVVRVLVQTHIVGIEYQHSMNGQYRDNLAYLYLLEKASKEDRKALISNAGESNSTLLPLHVKYGTASYLLDRFKAGLMTARSLLSVRNMETIDDIFGTVCDYLDFTYIKTQPIVEER